MADIRIKDLTTTASTTAADDFFAADGATNGTRKLSAYSPSFGGNATVGGTLTVNSTFASSASSTTLTSQFANTLTGAANILNLQLRRGDSANGFSRLMWGTGATTEWSLGSRSGDTNIYLWDEVANAERLKVSSSTGNVSIAASTASTTTSSGALVVGNGTSGGLGVGGNAYIGGDLVLSTGGKAIYSQGYVAAKGVEVNLLSRGTNNGWTTGLHFYSSNSDYSATWLHNPGSGDLTLYSSSSSSNYASTDRALLINTSKQVQVLASTASTSTSSGALVVSGGVGVAGSINAGTNGSGSTHIFTGGDGGSGSTIFALKDNAGTTRVNVDGVGTVGIGVNLVLSGSSNVFRITNAQTPASASATGTAGTIAWDTSYIYVCTATNTWKRAAISTW
jgi:hypothetical protein